MSRERFEELKEAYALNALSEAERREVEEYLAENPSEQTEIDELSSIASLLALAPPEKEPPAQLRKSLMDQVRSEGAREPASGGEPRESEGGLRRLFAPRRLAAAIAALLLVGLVAWNVLLQSEVRDLRDLQMSAYKLQGSGEASETQGQVLSLDGERAMLVATNLPALPEGRTYEMWAIDEGQPESRGVFEAREGPAIETIEQPISGAETFAITVEPEGGSEQPTTDPIVVADLTRDA